MNICRRRWCRGLLFFAWLAVAAPTGAIEVVCHRGANEHAPENTYAAAQKCIDWGVEYVEIDVRTSKDGVMYIMHDFTVDRTTDGKGLVHALTSEQIDELDAGSWFGPEFAGEKVPRVDEYLRWIKGKSKVYFDVKAADLEKLIALVYDVGMQEDCFFWFGSPRQAEQFREIDDKLALKVNVRSPADVRKAHEELDATIVEVGLDNMSPELLDVCRELGIKIMVYHPQKDLDAFRKAIESGAEMINCNHGDLVKQVERELSAAKTGGD